MTASPILTLRVNSSTAQPDIAQPPSSLAMPVEVGSSSDTPSVDPSPGNMACQSVNGEAIASPSQPSIAPHALSITAEFNIFVSTFLTIFLAELGDKTQLTTLLMSAESQAPWVVFAGAGAALVLTSLLGILLGRWLAQKLSPKTLDLAAGTMLLLIASFLFFDLI